MTRSRSPRRRRRREDDDGGPSSGLPFDLLVGGRAAEGDDVKDFCPCRLCVGLVRQTPGVIERHLAMRGPARFTPQQVLFFSFDFLVYLFE